MHIEKESELVQHRCAIYGSSHMFPGYTATLEYLKETIGQAIADGFVTFVTAARDGYELDAAKFICKLKREFPELRLVIVQPYMNRDRFWGTIPVFQSICSQADMVKYISVPNDPDALAKTDRWIVKHCSRIICTTNSAHSKIERLQGIDLSGKESVRVAVRWSKEQNEYVHADVIELPKLKEPTFPQNLLCDILDLDLESHKDIADEFPEDIASRIFSTVSQYGERHEEILRLRYCENKTLREIGDVVGVSHERIRQIIKKTIKRLRYKKSMEFLRGGETRTISESVSLQEKKDKKNDSSLDLDKWRPWTEEEISCVQKEIETLTLEEVARIHNRHRMSVARVIKVTGLLSDEQLNEYCVGIELGAFHKSDRINSYEKWTKEEEIHLLEMLNDGKDIEEIASEHERTNSAIRSRLAKLNGQEWIVKE